MAPGSGRFQSLPSACSGTPSRGQSTSYFPAVSFQRKAIDSTRTADTANHVFSQVAEGKFISVQMPAVVAAPAIDALLIASAA
jgi:hypothetical protein